MSPLEAATMEELIAEMKKRVAVLVIAYSMPSPTDPANKSMYGVFFGGSIVPAVGCASYAHSKLTEIALHGEDVTRDDAQGH